MVTLTPGYATHSSKDAKKDMSYAQTVSSGAVREKRNMLADLCIRIVKEKPLGLAGAVFIFAAIVLAILAPVLTPFDPNQVNIGERLLPPSSQYLLGTDNQGRDLLTRILFGARVSLIVGFAAPAIAGVVSLVIGIATGFMGGKFDIIVQRFVDAWMAFPALMLYLLVMSIFGGGLVQVVMVLGILGGILGSRTIRSAVIGIKENVYVEAARAIGGSKRHVMMSHILPNIVPMVIILFTTYMAGAILAEASLSFLGFGVPPPNPSWGGMLSGAGRKYMEQAPWMALWPGLCLSLVVYSVSMLGDAVRDILDPRLRGGIGRYSNAPVGRKAKNIRQRRGL
jgi:peptide/nickel transport system permease protein